MTVEIPEKKIYCFDSSAFISINRADASVIKLPDEIWEEIDSMMKSGNIISHEIVFDEICSKKSTDFLSKWIIDKKPYFLSTTQSQADIVADIIKKFPSIIDYKAEKEQADPWLISLAIETAKNTTLFAVNISIVVSQENPNSSKKIPAVCKQFKVKHMSLREFFDDIGVSTKLVKDHS
ncbi:MAG: DUF4411 family protein [Candidatus Portnoybacteria bacterium]|nr:DUF4411 family protein [Candidatus Portnoybacteria bacterium]MDD4983007.1 DUF4411 family protein [Candidatus Portnoybacteria bacterium]